MTWLRDQWTALRPRETPWAIWRRGSRQQRVDWILGGVFIALLWVMAFAYC